MRIGLKFAVSVVCLLTFMFPRPTEAQDKGKVSGGNLESYVGSYEVAPGVDLQITSNGTQLFLQAPGQQKVPLEAGPDGKFSVPGAGAEVMFEKDETGTVTGLVLHQGGNRTIAKRKNVLKRAGAETSVESEKTRADILREIAGMSQKFTLNPNGGERFEYGQLLYQAGEFWKAREIMEPLAKSAQAPNDALRLSADLEYLTGNYDAAEKLYKRIIDANGGTMAMVNLLFTYYQTNQFSKAKEIEFPKGVNLPNYEQMKAFDKEPYQTEWDNREKAATVPFLMTDPLPVLIVEVNGVPVTMFFDSGADQFILDTEIAQAIGIESVATATGSFGGGKKAEIGFGKVDTVTLGGVALRQVPVTILPTKRFSKAFQDGRYTIGGIIGTAAMRQFLGTLDYKNGRLVLRERTEANARKLRQEMKGKIAGEMPFALQSTHLMMAKGSLNGTGGLTFFVDSGLASKAGFSAPVQTLKYVGISVPETRENDGGVGGGGGTYASGTFAIKSLGLGDLKQYDLTGEYGSRPPETFWSAGFMQDGLISHQFLRQYSSWTIDFDSMKYIFAK